MNPSGGEWNNPPPPGTEVTEEFSIKTEPAATFLLDSTGEDRLYPTSIMKVEEMLQQARLEYENESSTSSKIKSEPGEEILKNKSSETFLKNSDGLEHDKKGRDRSRHRRRSHSRSKHLDKHKKSRGKHRSRSRDRHRRSRSRGHRHRRHRSTSSSRSRHSKSKREKRHRRSSSRRRRHYSKTRHDVKSDSEKEDPINMSADVDDDDEPSAKENAFKNDGSFLEMFKKMQEEQQKAAEVAKEQAGSSDPNSTGPPVPKRRGGRILKTGLVEKAKVIDEFMQGDGLDAWSVYMKEVKRYKEACCDDDSKTRPLVK